MRLPWPMPDDYIHHAARALLAQAHIAAWDAPRSTDRAQQRLDLLDRLHQPPWRPTPGDQFFGRIVPADPSVPEDCLPLALEANMDAMHWIAVTQRIAEHLRPGRPYGPFEVLAQTAIAAIRREPFSPPLRACEVDRAFDAAVNLVVKLARTPDRIDRAVEVMTALAPRQRGTAGHSAEFLCPSEPEAVFGMAM